MDQIRPRAQKSILFISQGIKLLRSGKFDESLGTALAHGKDDKLVINEGGGYKGGRQIAGRLRWTISLRINLCRRTLSKQPMSRRPR